MNSMLAVLIVIGIVEACSLKRQIGSQFIVLDFKKHKTITMELPKFILGDNTDLPTAIFVIHTEYPRFIINLEDDEVEWLEEFSIEDEKDLESEVEGLIEQATAFYDREVSRYEE